MHKKLNRYSTMSLEDLFLLMSWQADDRMEAEAAFSELYSRYLVYLSFICKTYKMFNDERDIEVQETIRDTVFNDAFSNAGKLLNFKKGVSDYQKDKMFKGWLGKTSKNEFLKIIKRKEKFDQQFPEFTSDFDTLEIPEYTEPTETFASNERKLLEFELNKLTEKERDITFTYLKLEDEQGNIDPDIREKLAKTYKILPDSLRQVKKRTVEKLINKLNPPV